MGSERKSALALTAGGSETWLRVLCTKVSCCPRAGWGLRVCTCHEHLGLGWGSRVREPREPHPRPGLGLPRLGGQPHMEGEKQTASVNFMVNSPRSTPMGGVPVRCHSSTEPLIQGGRGCSGFCDCWFSSNRFALLVITLLLKWTSLSRGEKGDTANQRLAICSR